MIHPQDAQTYSIQDKEWIEVSSEWGSIQIEAELSEDIIQGTVSIPHDGGMTGREPH